MKYRSLLVCALIFLIAPFSRAADGSTAAGFTPLKLGEAAALPGALAISADGRTAAHISTDGAIKVWETANASVLETIPAEDNYATAVALSPDGDLVAVGHAESKVTVRSRRANNVVGVFSGHTDRITALAFSPDGRLLASGGDDGTTQLWDLSSGGRLRIFDSQLDPIFPGSVAALGFAANGRVLVVNEWYNRKYEAGRSITLWDIEEGIEISTRDDAGFLLSSSLMHAGQALGGQGWLLAYASRDGLMVERLDRCGSGRQLPAVANAFTVAADPQGRWIAANGYDRKISFFGTTGDPSGHATTLPGRAVSVVPHPDGRSVFALLMTDSKFSNEADLETAVLPGLALYRVQVPAALLSSSPIAVAGNATHCAPAAAVRMRQAFRLPGKPAGLTATARLVLPGEIPGAGRQEGARDRQRTNPPSDLYFSGDGSLYVLYYAGSDLRSGVGVWNPVTGNLLRARFKKHVDSFTRPLRLPNGWAERFSTSSWSNLLTGKTPLPPYEDVAASTQADPDTGELFRMAPGTVERYAADGRRLPDVETGDGVIAFAVRNGRLAALDSKGNVQVWQFNGDGKPKLYPSAATADYDNYDIQELALSADGRFLHAPYQGESPVEYPTYDLATAKRVADRRLLAPFPGRSTRGVTDDTRPYRVAVRDFATGEVIARLPRQVSSSGSGIPASPVAAISDDGRLVASGSRDGLVRLWDLETHRLLGEARMGDAVTVMAFKAGKALAVGANDGEVRVFDVPATE